MATPPDQLHFGGRMGLNVLNVHHRMFLKIAGVKYLRPGHLARIRVHLECRPSQRLLFEQLANGRRSPLACQPHRLRCQSHRRDEAKHCLFQL
jgi:hypothetical protein